MSREKNFYYIILPTVVVISLLICLINVDMQRSKRRRESNELSISEGLVMVKNKSYFNEYSIDSEKVYFRCIVTIKNNSTDGKNFTMSGNFVDDFNTGMLKTAEVMGYDDELMTNRKFRIEAGQTERFRVIFVGDYGGGRNRKLNRLLPEVYIDELVN